MTMSATTSQSCSRRDNKLNLQGVLQLMLTVQSKFQRSACGVAKNSLLENALQSIAVNDAVSMHTKQKREKNILPDATKRQ